MMASSQTTDYVDNTDQLHFLTGGVSNNDALTDGTLTVVNDTNFLGMGMSVTYAHVTGTFNILFGMMSNTAIDSTDVNTTINETGLNV